MGGFQTVVFSRLLFFIIITITFRGRTKKNDRTFSFTLYDIKVFLKEIVISVETLKACRVPFSSNTDYSRFCIILFESKLHFIHSLSFQQLSTST